MVKYMPLNNEISTPSFAFLVTFLLCGCVIGAFTGSYVPSSEMNNLMLDNSSNTFVIAIMNALKYNIFALILGRFFGFAIPLLVFTRGYFLSFSVSAIYSSSENFFDSQIIIESFINNIVAIPCFLIISSICLNIFINTIYLKAKKARAKARLENSYFLIILCLAVNILWNLFCNFIF